MDKKKEKAEGLQTIRINKYLSDAGVCSRREADRLIEAGRITVNGKTVSMGDRISPETEVCLDGKPVFKNEKKVLLLFYKPKGVVCSTKKQRQEVTVTEYLNYPLRIYPVGRLDKDSEGLLLLTNEGDLVNRIMRAGNQHEKEYLVTVDKPIDSDFIRKMSEGVPVLDTVTRPCTVEKTGKQSFRIILTQGLNRQIRRMCAYFGYRVTSLKRIRIMNLTLDGIPEGAYREIYPKEWEVLWKSIQGSSSETVKEAGKKIKKAVHVTGGKRLKEAGGYHGNIHTANERTGRKTQPGGQSILSGRPGNHEQSGVRRSVRPAFGNGKGDRDRSGKQPDGQRRV